MVYSTRQDCCLGGGPLHTCRTNTYIRGFRTHVYLVRIWDRHELEILCK
jgi:hypothetical protein